MPIRYVVDDALPEHIYLNLEKLVTGRDIDWVLNTGTCGEQTNFGDWRFTHTVYHQRFALTQKYIQNFMPVFDFLGVDTMIKSKLNCDIYTKTPEQRPWHVDQGCHADCTFTSIMYFNDCNGKTIFKKDNATIQSKRNRAIVFNSELEHAGITQTDTARRYVLNTNFLCSPSAIPTGVSF